MSSDLKKIIYAYNIHDGGGKTLLLPILQALESSEEVLYVLDIRLKIEGWKPKGTVIRVKPSFFSRIYLELSLIKIIKPCQQLLCMGNLPPIFVRTDNLTVFVQNCFLVNHEVLNEFSFFIRCRIKIERWLLKFLTPKVSRFIVQTKTMAFQVKKTLKRESFIFPFSELTFDLIKKEAESSQKKQYDFVYVASGEPHKNHKKLLLAWIKLAQLNHLPSLCLILSRNKFPRLYEWIDTIVKKNCLNIEIKSELSRQQVADIYRKSKALIYPSKYESFGLPLIEAVSIGLPVLASDLSYVYDVIKPSMVFNPNSSDSIAFSVINFTYKPASFKCKINNTANFLNQAFKAN